MPVANLIAKLRPPQGLAARAVVFTSGVMLATAVMCVTVVLWGAQRESARYQLELTHDLTLHLATVSGNMIARGNMRALNAAISGALGRDGVRRVYVGDPQNNPLAAGGGSAADIAAVTELSARALAAGHITYIRTSDGGLAVAMPIIRDGQTLGVAARMWDQDAYRFQAIPALAPFLLVLALLALIAIPLTAYAVRRAVAPLAELSKFAEDVAAHGHAPPVDVRTGDEFETLARAFNHMMARLDASMRRIQQIAFVDPATQLPNQDRFIRELDHFILQGKGEMGMVAVFELQRLPRLMQTLDHDAARDFLRVVAERFASATRTVDRIVRLRPQGEQEPVLARLGGMEFAVFSPSIGSPSDAARFAQHLNAALNQPFEWRGHKFTLGACCGVAIAPRDGRDADAALRHARMALGAAQNAAARVKVFTPSLDREAVARLTLEREMREALERNEFRAFFQPKIDLGTGRIGACEALARWVRPDRTIISPGRFIPVAEEGGLIGPLSDAIMREACWKAAAWARAGYPIKVAVNVSALQFRSDRFAENVLRVVQHAGLAPDHLELEITESVVMEDPDRALRVIRPLRDAGVRLAIDDFGCGHSSLAALSKLPFDVIKIDQQFVRAIEHGDPQAEAIVDMILALARTLKLEVVAEGVERRDDVEFFAQRGCHWIQGFLYGAAVSAPEFAELLRRQGGEDVESVDAA
ncbi:MAG: EAL domain-containing protein [Hyphomonadaceae bacterium]|nr:EAL domain-containing protein [Hyphomonadaceae bacterium]